MTLHIVFVEPEIPPNTGNIARTCAATGTKLHLIEPLGFSIEDKALKRAGLDYWEYVDLEIHKNLKDFLEKYEGMPMYLSTTKAEKIYTDMKYEADAMFLFGKETKGLPREFINSNMEKAIRIPMSKETRLRSFNLANSANIVLFEALRQLGFPNLR